MHAVLVRLIRRARSSLCSPLTSKVGIDYLAFRREENINMCTA